MDMVNKKQKKWESEWDWKDFKWGGCDEDWPKDGD
jgi:hypothetical protein